MSTAVECTAWSVRLASADPVQRQLPRTCIPTPTGCPTLDCAPAAVVVLAAMLGAALNPLLQ